MLWYSADLDLGCATELCIGDTCVTKSELATLMGLPEKMIYKVDFTDHVPHVQCHAMTAQNRYCVQNHWHGNELSAQYDPNNENKCSDAVECPAGSVCVKSGPFDHRGIQYRCYAGVNAFEGL